MPNTEPPPTPEQAMAPSTGIGAKMANIFVTPAEVFDEVKSSPINSANWLVPLIAGIVMGIIFTMTVYSQPAVIQQLREPAEIQMQKLVKSGKLTQQKADQQLALTERIMSPGFLKVIGIFAMLFMAPAMLFFLAMLFWLVCRFAFHAHYDFMKVVEGVSLCGMIGVLNFLLMTFVVVIYGSLYMNIGPVLLIKQFNSTNPLHVLIQSNDVIWLWYLVVLAIALARFTGTRFFKAALWPFGVWAVFLAMKIGLVYFLAKMGGKLNG